MNTATTIQRAYQFRYYPTAAQRIALNQYFGAARWVWNACLAWRSHAYKVDNEKVTGVDFSRELTFLKTLESLAWLKQTPATVYDQVLRDQDRAFVNFFAKRARYPRFKKRTHAPAIRFSLDHRRIQNNYRAGQLLKLPGLGVLNLRWSRIPTGIPKMITVRRDPCGRYFVAFPCEETVEQLPANTPSTGIDVGLKDVIVTKQGYKSGNPRYLRRYQRRLKCAQRRLSRKQKGSKRWHKQRIKVARVHAKIHNCRQDFLQKHTTQLVRDYGAISIEDLNVKGLAKNRHLAKSMYDAALGELRRQFEYKTAWYGRELFFAPRFAPTSKTCSKCKAVMNSMPLRIRYWICPVCGAFHDRDVNAATEVEDDPKGGRPECYAHGGQQAPSAHQFTLTGMLVPIEVRTKPIRQSNNLGMINGLT